MVLGFRWAVLLSVATAVKVNQLPPPFSPWQSFGRVRGTAQKSV
jgi:rRNA maturation protein Nop10